MPHHNRAAAIRRGSTDDGIACYFKAHSGKLPGFRILGYSSRKITLTTGDLRTSQDRVGKITREIVRTVYSRNRSKLQREGCQDKSGRMTALFGGSK